MRKEFASAVIQAKNVHANAVFITGDLGYMAFEEVIAHYGKHFVNAGVAEQNMVTVAAGLAHEGFIPIVYSIAPFVTLRPYEQLRNDVCLHNLPVKVIGNGGGYGYGIMGATHHNLEDIGALRMLPNMKVLVPLVADDVAQAVAQMMQDASPHYLRLNYQAKFDFDVAPFAEWRHIKQGEKATVIGTGPVLQNMINAFGNLDYWCVSMFPITTVPDGLVESINRTGKIIYIEEHRGEGGLRETLSFHLIDKLQLPVKVLSLAAAGYPSGRYGSQQWHQQENSLGGENMLQAVNSFLK